MSLIPEKPLIISPSLAATIGLEEAVLLQVLSDFVTHGRAEHHNGYDWFEVSAEQLGQFVPFWNERDIQRSANSLRDKGILLIASAPFSSSHTLRFTLNQSSAPKRRATSAIPAAPVASAANAGCDCMRRDNPSV